MIHKNEYCILVIEDNLGDFVLVETFLKEQIEKLVLLRATNFKEAKAILSVPENKFDIVLLDLTLPDKMGLQLINEIMAIGLTIPVIVLTGYADTTFGEKSRFMGISDYILKDDLTPSMLYTSILCSTERKKAGTSFVTEFTAGF